jgi:hypothetical protein
MRRSTTRRGTWFAALLLGLLALGSTFPATASGQAFIENVGGNVNVSAALGNQAEATIAVNPTNTQQIFVASNPGTTARRSTDGGQTWNPVNPGFAGAQAPCCDNVAAWDQFGNLFLVYLSLGADGAIGGTPASTDQTIELALSVDGGQTFNIIQQIDGPARVDQPSVAVGGGSVWVTWNRGNIIAARGATVTGLGTGNIGAFTAIQTAPESGGGVGQFGDVAVGPGGQVVVTYQSNTQIFTNTDADGTGAGGFAAAVTVTNTNVAKFDSVPPQDARTIDAEANLAYDRSGGPNNGRLYMSYTDEQPDESNDTDIFVRRSNDNGANWSAPVQVNDDAGANTQMLPAISVDQTSGFLGISWHDARNDAGNNNTQLFGAFSSDGGVTFRPNLQISAGTSNEDTGGGVVEYGDYTWASFVAGDFYPVWADNSNSTGDNPDFPANPRFDIYTARVHFEVNDPPVVSAGPDVSGSEGSPISLDGTVTQNDEAGFDPITTTWTANAGAPCTFANAAAVDTTITCSDNGNYTATLTADDGDNPAVADSALVQVDNVPPTVTAGAPATLNEGDTFTGSGSFTDPGNDTWTATVDYGDGTGVQPLALNADKTFSLSHVYADDDADDTYTITVSVSDDEGGTGTDSFDVTVLNVAPSLTITSPATGDLYEVNTPVSVVAPFTDPGADTHTCFIDWDNGSTETYAASGSSCSRTHTYTGAGVYTIVLTVTDDDGGADTESVMVVVFDPEAGFVTGGGWINSPAGAYTADPSLTGRATFGFVSKYQKGAKIPVGQTEFQFRVADFNFHSDLYDWLVVTGGGKAQYKGTGTVNGVAGFNFLLTATDGHKAGGDGVDKFRMKIWDGGGVVYDNAAGASEDIDIANPQAIAGGSIVIHAK